MHYVPCLCLQAVLRCPGNTDGGWRARIQKTINLWQQLETEISHSFTPGCCQKTSLFTLAAVVLFLCPEASVFYLIPACGPDRSGSDRTTVSAVGGTPTSASICSAAMYDATPRIALARTGVCRSKERERLPLCYFFFKFIFNFYFLLQGEATDHSTQPVSTGQCSLSSALEEIEESERSGTWSLTPLNGETWRAQVRRRREGAPRVLLCYLMFITQTPCNLCFH